MFKTAAIALLTLIMTAALAAVDANTASEADLDSIKGIGPSTSGKIVAARRIQKFKDWSDFILRTHGVGAKRAAKLSNQGLTVNGQAFNISAPEIASAKRDPQPVKPSAYAPRQP